jgi:cell division protein FtsX
LQNGSYLLEPTLTRLLQDGFMTFAMALSVAAVGVVVAECSYGAGRHIGDVDPSVYMIGNKLNFITQPMYLIDICVVKLAVGASLLRIASTKFYKIMIISVMGFMAFYTIGCFFVRKSVALSCGRAG